MNNVLDARRSVEKSVMELVYDLIAVSRNEPVDSLYISDGIADGWIKEPVTVDDVACHISTTLEERLDNLFNVIAREDENESDDNIDMEDNETEDLRVATQIEIGALESKNRALVEENKTLKEQKMFLLERGFNREYHLYLLEQKVQ